MNIALSTDDNYVMPCGVLLCSICENNRDERINFYILIQSLMVDNIKVLRQIVEQYNQKIIFHVVDKSLFNFCPVGMKNQAKYITLPTYYRIILPDLLLEVDKILYLDCDIIVRKSLQELWSIDLNGYAVGVVMEGAAADKEIYKRLEYPFDDGYFNAGVLLMNLSYWRTYDISKQVLDYIARYPERLLCNDQDALNAILHDKRLLLPLTYNVQDEFYWHMNYAFIDLNEMYAACDDPAILHFSGMGKPWFKECDHRFKSDFLMYMSKTQWKNLKLKRQRMNLKDRYWYLRHLVKKWFFK